MAVNVLGTWHVLLSADAVGAGRVVYFSSGQVFGLAEGERLPDYFPVDGEHPRRAMRPYAWPRTCAWASLPSVALRPAWIWDLGMYQRIEAQWRADPGSEWTPTWEYGKFVDVRDVADAVQRALDKPRWSRLRLCAQEHHQGADPPGLGRRRPRGIDDPHA